MTTDTPTPYTPPDGVILTTIGEARRIGHGQVLEAIYGPDEEDERWLLQTGWRPEVLVWWRPTPGRTVTIELPESVAREIAGSEYWERENARRCFDAVVTAIARLDGDD